jgi:NADPH:quinone reductase-like Zn-dependent oxidoreductase
MATMKAVIMQSPNTASFVTDRPFPSLRPTYIKIRVRAVALNPADYKHIDYINTPSALLGCDYAGEVLEVGAEVRKHWAVGDRVCGFVHGGNSLQKEDGAYAEVIVAKGDVQLRIPEGMSFEDAATLGAGVLTCGQGLYQKMELSWPNVAEGKGEVVLIYGGSSATGTLGIQFAKL